MVLLGLDVIAVANADDVAKERDVRPEPDLEACVVKVQSGYINAESGVEEVP